MHSLNILTYLMGQMPLFEQNNMYFKKKKYYVFWRCIFTVFFKYYDLYTITTTTQNQILIWNNLRRWINTPTIERLWYMTYYFILERNIWIYFIIAFFFLLFSWPHFLNVILQNLISTFLYALIFMALIHNVSYMQI